MSRGRPRKSGKRRPNGRLIPSPTFDRGTERAQIMRAFYGTDCTDAIGRALGGGSSDGRCTDGEPPMSTIQETNPTSKRPRKMARESNPAATAEPSPKSQTKTDLVLDLLSRSEGATLDQLVAATGWLPHTARAALTGLKKKGHAITSDKAQGGSRVYRVEAA